MSKWPGTVIDDEELYAAQSTGEMPAQQKATPVTTSVPGVDMDFPGAEVAPTDPQLVDGGYAEIGGFADELPRQAASQMAPEDEAAIRDMLLRGAGDSEITEFAASKGFRMTNLDAVRKALTQTGQVNKNALYELPTVALPEEDRTAAATARGVADTVTFGTLPKLGAVVGATADWLNDDASFAEAYNRHLDENNGVIQGDERDHPYARIAGQLAGAVVLPAGIEGVGMRAGSQVLRAGGTISEARAAAAAAVRNRLAAVGGGYGAAHGAGSGDTIGEAVTGAVTEGAIGAAGGTVAGLAGQVIAPRMAARAATARAAPISEGQRVAAAAERQGVDVLPADVGGPTTRRLTSAAAQAPISAAPIINAGQRAVDQSAAVRDRVAQSVGQALNPEAAGETGIRGARAFIARTSQRANTLYRAAETQANGVVIQPTEALAALTRNIRELRDTPGGAAGLARLEGLRDALQDGQFSAPGIRRMRTALRDEFIEAGLRGSDIERRVNQVVDAANDDIANSLTQAGRPNAARAFRVADRYWRNRIATIDDNLAPIIGKEGDASGEQVVQRLTAAMNGNNARFSAFISALPVEDQATVRASLIARIGRSTSGAQNDTGDAFSLATFLTNWDKIGERAKARLLTPEGRAAMNDLATIASGARQTAGYANRSNTSGGIWGNLGVAGGVAAASPVTAISGLIAQYGAGRLLSSPRLTRWLARSATTRVPATEYIARLSRIAKAEPAIANDVLSLQARLAEAFGPGAPARLAAHEGGNHAGVINGQDGNRQSPAEGAQP